jgi:hypothetical protein
MINAFLSSLVFPLIKALTCGFSDFAADGESPLRDILNVGERKKST